MGVYSIGLYVLVSLIRVNYTICTNFFRANTSLPSTFNVSERHFEQIEVRSKLTTERTSIYVYMYAFMETSNAVDRFLLEIRSRGSRVADHVTTLAIFVNEKLWTASWLRDGERIYRRWPSKRQRVVIQLIREELYSFVFRLNVSEIPRYTIKWKFLKYFKHVHTKNDIRADKFWTIRVLQ